MIPDIAQPLFEAFAKAGQELYLVGGCVRDFVIHRTENDTRISAHRINTEHVPKDLDFATSAPPATTMEILKGAGFETFPIGLDFGTVGSKLNKFDVEITTYRCKESYTKGNRKPSVQFGTSLLEDLYRRDFTINAMAMDSKGEIYDPFDGFQAYIEGLLTTPCDDPEMAFTDDPLRMLRAFRFCGRFGMSLCWLEEKMLQKCKGLMHTVSPERIFDEMSKILMLFAPGATLKYMGRLGILGEMFPELQGVIDFRQNQGKYHSKLVWPHVLDVVDNSAQILPVRWAALFHDVSKPETYSESEGTVHFIGHEPKGASVWNVIAERLHVSNAFKEEVWHLIYHHLRFAQLGRVPNGMITKSALRRFIRESGPYLENLYLLSMADITSHKPDLVAEKRARCMAIKQEMDEIMTECDIYSLRLPTGLGRKVAEALNIAKGTELGRIMRQLKDGLIAGSLTESSDFIAEAKRLKRQNDGLKEISRLGQEIDNLLKKQQARLENWLLAPFRWQGKTRVVLVGEVYGHPDKKDGNMVVTSDIVEVDFTNRRALTQNTIYTLLNPSDKHKAFIDKHNEDMRRREQNIN